MFEPRLRDLIKQFVAGKQPPEPTSTQCGVAIGTGELIKTELDELMEAAKQSMIDATCASSSTRIYNEEYKVATTNIKMIQTLEELVQDKIESWRRSTPSMKQDLTSPVLNELIWALEALQAL